MNEETSTGDIAGVEMSLNVKNKYTKIMRRIKKIKKRKSRINKFSSLVTESLDDLWYYYRLSRIKNNASRLLVYRQIILLDPMKIQ